MSDQTTAARPYAKAAFEFAQDKGSLEAMSGMLSFCAAVVANEEMAKVVANPKLGKAKLTEIVLAVCKDKIDDAGENLLKLLVENQRLAALPAIAVQFEALKAEAEGKVEAVVIAAKATSDEYLAKIGTALKKRLGRDVIVSSEIDESLLGGAIIKAGDLVIDGSMRGRIEQLATSMSR